MPQVRANVDKAWFMSQMKERDLTVRSMAKRLNIHYSALSRTLNGERRMQVDEIRRIAEILGKSERAVSAHVGSAFDRSAENASVPALRGKSAGKRARAKSSGRHPGFGFMEGQVAFKDALDMNSEDEEYIVPPRGADPLFGCMAGTLTLLPDVDYTAPADPDWGKVYDD